LTAAKRLEWQYKFREYDVSGDNKLDQTELKRILTMGNPTITDAEVAKLFKKVDTNNDGTIDFDEFIDFLHDAASPVQPAPPQVKVAFNDNYKDGMDHGGFVGFCRDCKLLDLQMQQRDADLLFTKVCPRGRQRILYEHFEKLLGSIADRKGIKPAQIHDQILRSRKWTKGTMRSTLSPPRHEDSPMSMSRASSADSAVAEEGGGAVDWEAVERTFAAFCKQGEFMERMEFSKLCEDCWLLDRDFRKADVDIIFSRVMNPKKKIDFEIFKEALQALAERKGQPIWKIQHKVGRSKGPKFLNASVAATARPHGDSDADKNAEAEYDGGEESGWSWCRKSYKAFGGPAGLTGVDFFKMCTECGIFDDTFSKNDADCIFSGRSQRQGVVTFEQFQGVVRDVAKKKGCPVRSIQEAVGWTIGPTFKGTVADSVRLHDDRSAYTGTHARK